MKKQYDFNIEELADTYVKFNNGLYFDIETGGLSYTPPLSNQENDYLSGFDTNSYIEVIPQLELPLTHRCNMRCTYCSFRHFADDANKSMDMDMKTIKQAIKFYRQYLESKKVPYARIDFGVTGEPYLRQNLHETVFKLIEKEFENSSVQRIWAGPYITNATHSNSDNFIDNMGFPQDISCDGPKSVHDNMRKYPNGEGSYDDLYKATQKIIQKHPQIGVSTVLTSEFIKFDQIFLHLYEELGFKCIYMKPVNAIPDKHYSLNASNVELFKQGYTRLVNMILNQPKDKMILYLMALNKEDFFFRYFYRIKDRYKQIHRCGAGKSGVYVDTDGKLYPCAHFIGNSPFDIGNIYDGFNNDLVEKFYGLTIFDREPCKKCWARYLCGGGCYYQSLLANDKIDIPDEAKCDLIRFICMENIRLLSFIRMERSDIYDLIPEPFYLLESNINKDASDIYQPCAILKKGLADKHFDLTQPGRLKGAYYEKRPVVLMKITQNNDSIKMEFNNLQNTLYNIKIWLIDFRQDPFYMYDLYNINTAAKGFTFQVNNKLELLKLKKCKNKVQRIPFSADEWIPAQQSIIMQDQEKLVINLSYKEIFGKQKPTKYGLNIFLDFSGGGTAAFIQNEPYCIVDTNVFGTLEPSGGEFIQISNYENRDINPIRLQGMVPIGRWMKMKPNVC